MGLIIYFLDMNLPQQVELCGQFENLVGMHDFQIEVQQSAVMRKP